MATSNPITPDQAVQDALDYVKKYDQKDYANLEKPENAAELKKIEAAAKKSSRRRAETSTVEHK